MKFRSKSRASGKNCKCRRSIHFAFNGTLLKKLYIIELAINAHHCVIFMEFGDNFSKIYSEKLVKPLE